MSENKYVTRIRNLGFRNFMRYTFHQKTKSPKSGTFILESKHADHPLTCRGGTSDIDVFKHIYVIREYMGLDHIRDARLIIDCGANAGFSTSYFLSRFPEATVVAVEPDPTNFKMLELNTAPYGDRCIRLQAGVWSKPCGLCIADAPFGDGREWARCVREAGPSETPDISAVEIGQLLEQSDSDRISILKIDIEGSEQEVFAASDRDWLRMVDCIVIELHGEDCSRTYFEAVQNAGFTSVACGGLTISTRTRLD